MLLRTDAAFTRQLFALHIREGNQCQQAGWPSFSIRCAKGVGFGPKRDSATGGKSKKASSKEKKKGVSGIVETLERDERMKGAGGGLINPREAAEGRVDFVRVDGWDAKAGSSDEDVGSLKVKSFSQGFDVAEEQKLPFYDRLVRRIQLMESRGEISVVQAQPMPDFKRWRFESGDYLQYLQNQLAVHLALEIAVAGLADPSSQPEKSDGAHGSDLALAVKGVSLVQSSLGLDRSEMIRRDIDALVKAIPELQGQGVEATVQTKAYVKYLLQLQLTGSDSKEAVEKLVSARLKLLANFFAIQIVHLTTGMRVGAKAVEKLDLVSKEAMSFYKEYPEHVGNPLKVFVDSFNEIGNLLSLDMQEDLVGELPKALQKTSLLLIDLAVEDAKSV